MHSLQIQVSDTAFAAIRAAAQQSSMSVEAVAADQLEADFSDAVPASFWTPELLATLDAASAEAHTGGGISMDEMRGRIAARDVAWRSNPPA